MNKSNALLALGLVPILVACASTGQVTVLEPVGPTPLRATAPKPESDGTLKVYSLRGIQTAEGVNYHPHTDYTLVSGANQRKGIHNAAHQYDEDPVAVFLPAGAYAVEALAQGYRHVRVPVVIEAGRLTAVYLESSKRPQVTQSDSQDWVRLPGGTTVGWRANLAAATTSPQGPVLGR